MEYSNIFKFRIIPVSEKLEIWNTELLAAGRWDNLFYRGQFFDSEIDHIRCITPCRNCYLSWFNISFADFSENKVEQLVADGFLTNDIIREKGMAEVATFGDSFYYKTNIEASANYVQVKCEHCGSKHLLILGMTETQPALYGGQLQGIWRIKE